MDDSSLDDFFAKKDKSKKKSKSSKIVVGDTLEKADEPVKKEKKKKAKETASNAAKDSKTIGLTVNPEEVLDLVYDPFLFILSLSENILYKYWYLTAPYCSKLLFFQLF